MNEVKFEKWWESGNCNVCTSSADRYTKIMHQSLSPKLTAENFLKKFN